MYPSISEYIESVRFAADNLDQLKHLTPVLQPNGEPFYSSGNFAAVFKMKDAQGNFFALKCFTQEVAGRDERYELICNELQCLQSGFFLSFRYFKSELFVDSANTDEELFPVLLMEWVEGIPLDAYIRNCITDGKVELLSLLSYRFGLFASWLAGQPFAHGDLKPDNLLVRSDGSLVAVDYDGMFVPDMADNGMRASELGSPDYRHPLRSEDSFNASVDDFSLVVIALSLEAIATEPTLLQRYARQDGLLFCEQDYRDLSACEVLKTIFGLLQMNPDLQTLFSLFLLVHKEQKLRMAMADCLRLPLPKTGKSFSKNSTMCMNLPKIGVSNFDIISSKKKEPSSSRTFTANGVSFTMKLVKAGTFMMGATPEMRSSNPDDDAYDDEFPVHEVTLTKDYYMGETQVTQALWQAVMGENPSHFTGDDRRPVEKVSWDDCQAFIQKLNALTGENFRLPTEAEWEYAARGGAQSKSARYAGSDDLDEVAWYDGNSGDETNPVAQKKPNELGLYDMSGNVWEWCADWYDENYYKNSPSVDPKGPDSGSLLRVLRGGSWRSFARYCRLSFRSRHYPDLRFDNFGLRLSL